MPLPRVFFVVLVAVSALMGAQTTRAGAFDACAQRVIRDWYSGGRVDGVYPLECYRAAIRALPEDVLQYSSADKDIARALEYARRGHRDPGNASAPSPVSRAPASESPVSRPRPQGAPPVPRSSAPAAKPSPDAGTQASARPLDGGARAAGAAEVDTAGAGLPYPVLALALLAVLLLLSAAATALRARRR